MIPTETERGVTLDRNMKAYLGKAMTERERTDLFALNRHLSPHFHAVALYRESVDDGALQVRIHLYRTGQPGLYTVRMGTEAFLALPLDAAAEAVIHDVNTQDWKESLWGKLALRVKGLLERIF